MRDIMKHATSLKSPITGLSVFHSQYYLYQASEKKYSNTEMKWGMFDG